MLFVGLIPPFAGFIQSFFTLPHTHNTWSLNDLKTIAALLRRSQFWAHRRGSNGQGEKSAKEVAGREIATTADYGCLLAVARASYSIFVAHSGLARNLDLILSQPRSQHRCLSLRAAHSKRLS